jgi:hypothetical protein
VSVINIKLLFNKSTGVTGYGDNLRCLVNGKSKGPDRTHLMNIQGVFSILVRLHDSAGQRQSGKISIPGGSR